MLLLLRRFRTTDSLDSLTYKTGRSMAHISTAVRYMCEHIEQHFPWLLLDERSLSSWAPHFDKFAALFWQKGLSVNHLVGYIDGKLWPICKPGHYQRVMYSVMCVNSSFDMWIRLSCLST